MEKMQVKVDLVGKDGNIYVLKGIFRKAAIRQGYSEDEVNALFEEMKKCESYHQAVGLLLENSVSEDKDDDDGDDDGYWDYCDD